MRILMRKNRWAFYIRLSREDGDRAESLSVVHQKLKLSEYAKTHPELTPYSWYIDDGLHWDQLLTARLFCVCCKTLKPVIYAVFW